MKTDADRFKDLANYPENRKLKIIILILVLINCALFYAIIALWHRHEWSDATCMEPMTCAECGKTKGESLGHTWVKATCTDPRTCSVCGETEGEPNGHKWENATCITPKTCRVCGKTEGEPNGHKWEDATCTEAKTCSVCGETEGDPLGHDWAPATYDAPMTCKLCGETLGREAGIISSSELEDGDYSKETVKIDDFTVHPWVFNHSLKKCRKIKIGYSINIKEGHILGDFGFWIRSGGEWMRVGKCTIDQEDKEFTSVFNINPARDIEAIVYLPENVADEDEATWSDGLWFYEAQVE